MSPPGFLARLRASELLGTVWFSPAIVWIVLKTTILVFSQKLQEQNLFYMLNER